jgi:catalase
MRIATASASLTQIDVNKPRCPVHSYQRDCQTRFDGNGDASPAYQPNSFDGPTDNKDCAEPPLRIDGDADRYSHRDGNDDYTQAGNLYRLMDEQPKKRLAGNIVAAMPGVPRDIQVGQIAHFIKADPAYGGRVAEGLGIDPAEVG